MPENEHKETLSKKDLIAGLKALSRGDFSVRLPDSLSGRDGELCAAFNQTVQNLRDAALKNAQQHWLKANEARFSRVLQGQRSFRDLAQRFFSELAGVVASEHAALYFLDRECHPSAVHLRIFHACQLEASQADFTVRLAEGAIGRCIAEKRTVFAVDVPFAHRVAGSENPEESLNLIVVPVLFEGRVEAVLELGAREPYSDSQREFLQPVSEHLGIALHTLRADEGMRDLLRQSQSLARELQRQQEQLRHTNEELEEKAQLLALQKTEMEAKNREVEQARQALQEKAAQMALTSKYKSEFLANMSHELRTPLNSMLLLARQLLDNQEQTLTPRQLEYAKVIHAAGQELLRLINDILDLSKIESGTVTVDVGAVQFWELQEFVERNFRPLAKVKNLQFGVELDTELPATMQTDARRLEQVLKNLLANAFKFTETGSVQLRVRLARSGWSSENVALDRSEAVVAFSVADTGIGISQEKQKIIFEAFQQADGSTSRKYGGTGLGLTICREIARLLGGEICVHSVVGEGTVFTLYLPLRYPNVRGPQKTRAVRPVELVPEESLSSVDDRASLNPGDRILLIVEDDPDFSACLLDLARKNGFKGLIAARGRSALEIVLRYHPDAITLDLTLPDMDGWKILERLKADPSSRHIPVVVISVDQERGRGLQQGAAAFLVKPAPAPVLAETFCRIKDLVHTTEKRVLLCSKQGLARTGADDMAGIPGVLVHSVATGQSALAALKEQRFDCVAIDLDLPDFAGLRLLEQLKRCGIRNIPILLCCTRELTSREQGQLRRLSASVLVKEVYSRDRLVDQLALCLHLPVANLPDPWRALLEKLHCSDEALTGKRIFIIDDDIRNIFALTSLLERHGMTIISCETGQGALEKLQGGLAVDMVLLDLMMPGCDGFEVLRTLRSQERFRSLPLITVTAKAMREDRLKCLEAGASDYIAKPVDAQQLLTTLRRWLHR